MKSIKEIFELVLKVYNTINDTRLLAYGICHVLTHLRIDEEITFLEYEKAIDYLTKHRPFGLNFLMNYPDKRYYYYWEQGETKPRIKWLKKHIERL